MIVYRTEMSPSPFFMPARVTPYWRNPQTGEYQRLTWAQLKQGRGKGPVIATANQPFYVNDVAHVYSRMGWAPYYVQPAMKYTVPNQMKGNGTRITQYDIDSALAI